MTRFDIRRFDVRRWYFGRHLGWLLLLSALFAGAAVAQSLPLKLSQGQLAVTVKHSDGTPDVVRELGMQQLPWKWDNNFLRQRGIMQFRFDFALDEALVKQLKSDGQGLALSSVKMGNRYRYRVNGGNWTAVGWEQTSTQYRLAPRWQLLPANSLKVGSNLLELEIKAEPANDSGLTEIELGYQAASLAVHVQRVTTRYATALVVGMLALLVCLTSLAIGWVTKEKIFFVAAAAEAAFAVSQFDWAIDYPPVSTWVFNAGRYVLFSAYVGLTCWVSTLLVKVSAPRVLGAVKIYLLLALPVLALGAAMGDYRVYQFLWSGVTTLLVSFCAARLFYYSWAEANAVVNIYTVGKCLTLAVGLYDWVLDLIPAAMGMARVSDYAFLVLNVVLGAVVVQRYLIVHKERDMLRVSGRLQAENATYRERQRMMQDIHDSVGSQLVALLGLVNSNAPRDQIQSHTAGALDELRLAVDAIDKVDGDLTVVLATLRHRLQPRLTAANLQLRWQVDALPRFDKLTPKDIQHIQRILLEVFSNIIQHAKAKEVVLSARYDADAKMCRISISDDGQGFDASATTGRGLSNIQNRAEMLGATLSFTRNEPHGTSVNLGIAVH